jgi:hypothetical protein
MAALVIPTGVCDPALLLKLTVICLAVALNIVVPFKGRTPSSRRVQVASSVAFGGRIGVVERIERMLPAPAAE